MIQPVSPSEFLKKKTLNQKEIDDLVMEINRKLNMYSDDLGEYKAVQIPADIYKELEKEAIIHAFTSTGEWNVQPKKDGNGVWLIFRPLVVMPRML